MNLKEKVEKYLADLSVTESGKVTCNPESDLYEIIHELHDGLPPSNLIFKTVQEILEHLNGYDFDTLDYLTEHDIIEEIANGIVPIPYHEQRKNFGEDPDIFDFYCNEVFEKPDNITEMISLAYHAFTLDMTNRLLISIDSLKD